MPPRRQPDLFESIPSPPTARDLRITRQGSKPLGKAQQLFNRLSAKVQKLRDELAQWGDFETRLRQQVVERLLPVIDEMTQVRRGLILQCADMLAGRVGGRIASAAERRRLTTFLIELCEAHLADAEDAEIIAVYDRYAGRTHAEALADERELAQAVDEIFGEETETSFDAERDGASTGDDHQTAGARRKGQRAAVGDAQAREASDAIRAVYRKLASALHPDRAADETERERRHQLMQRVNEAYESTDLLGLLTLQLEIEQIDEDHLTTVPERRLQHYNQVLREQVKGLEQELAHVLDHIRATIPNASRRPTPAGLEMAFEQALEEARDDLAAMSSHATDLLDPGYRRQWLNEYERERKEAEREMSDLEDILQVALDELIVNVAPRGPAPGNRGAGRKGKPRRKRD